MVTALNVIVPVLVVRLTPVPPEPVELVGPKLRAALDVATLMPMPVAFDTVVEPLDMLPLTLVRWTPVALLFVDDMLVKAAVKATGPLSIPVVRFNASPLPLIAVSASVRVPKLDPSRPMAAAAAPLSVTPRIVLLVPRIMV